MTLVPPGTSVARRTPSARTPNYRDVLINQAILGGVHGAAELSFRYRARGVREWRGTFAFNLQDELRVARLTETRIPVIFEGLIDGEPKRLEVMVTDVQSDDGLAHFEALGEPFKPT